jgi:hypothetical protein
MAKNIFIAIACLLLGAVIGNGIARYTEKQHQQTRAVMRLAQWHLDRLNAVAGQCKWAEGDREKLDYLAGEIATVFPLAYAQEVVFRKYADELTRAVTDPPLAPTCKQMTGRADAIREACDACHRDYR